MRREFVALDATIKLKTLSKLELEQAKLQVRGGKVIEIDSEGEWPIDTPRLFAMDDKGAIFTAIEAPGTSFRHSSFFGGKPLAAAGNIKFHDGRLTYIDTGSGHYKPPRESLKSALASLVTMGVDISGAVMAFGGNSAHRASFTSFKTPANFLFGSPESIQCIEKIVSDSRYVSPQDLRTFRSVDPKRFNRFVSKLERSGKMIEYEAVFKTLFQEDPAFKNKLPTNVANHFDPNYRRGRFTCAGTFLRDLFR